MPMSPFYVRCLQTALRETRNIAFPEASHGIPAGKYVFHEDKKVWQHTDQTP